MPPQIEALRVSTLFFEAFPQLLADSPPREAPMAFMGRSADYAREVERARRGEGPWTLPWPGERPSLNHFWRYYMDNQLPSRVTGERAWGYLVPLRRSVAVGKAGEPPPAPPAFEAPATAGGRWKAEAFFYPHGVALVVTVSLEGEQGLPAMVERAVEAQRALRFRILQSGAEDAGGRSVGEALRQAMVGATAPEALRSEAFSVATVLRGSGAAVARKVREGGTVHRALEGLCAWDPSWSQVTPQPQAEAGLPIRNAPAGHLLYARKRGRAVWFPAAFTSGRSRKSTLGCYHRNLTLVSLQVEALLQLMRLAQGYLERGDLMPTRLAGVARQGSDVLGRLYGGARGSYRSASAPQQVEDSGLKPAAEAVRHHFGQGPLVR